MLATAATTGTVITLAIIALAAGFFQSVTGFGFALVAVSLGSLVAAPHEVVIQTFFVSGLLSLVQTHRGLHDIAWRDALGLTVAAALAMPLGVVVLTHSSAGQLRVLLGACTLGALVWLVATERRGGDAWQSSWWSMAIAGGLSGVLNTSIATNGPPLVIYLRGRALSPESFRGTISFVFSVSNVVGAVVLIAGGAVHRTGVEWAAWTLGPASIGLVGGFVVAGRLDPETFRRLVNGLLAVSAVVVLAKGAGIL